MLAWRLPQVRAAVQPVTEKIMSKTTHDTLTESELSNELTVVSSGELRDDELNEVTGGLVVIAIIAVFIPLLLPAVNSS